MSGLTFLLKYKNKLVEIGCNYAPAPAFYIEYPVLLNIMRESLFIQKCITCHKGAFVYFSENEILCGYDDLKHKILLHAINTACGINSIVSELLK